MVVHLPLEWLKVRDVITQNSPWEEKAKIALEISVFCKLAHVEQVFGGLGVAVRSPKSTIDKMLPNLPAGSWKWQRDSEMSWRRCWLPWAPAATWRWQAAGAGTLSATQSCKTNTHGHLQGDGIQGNSPTSPQGWWFVPNNLATGKALRENEGSVHQLPFPTLTAILHSLACSR